LKITGSWLKYFLHRTHVTLTNLLFIQIERLRSVELTPSSKTNHLTVFYSLLEENFISIKDVTVYASKLNITAKQLNRLCLKYLEKNASTLIEERVNLEAMRLLFNSNLTVKEVALSLGFDDPSYFNRYFKRINNTTPNDFKTLMSDKYHKRVV
jgi:AraC family transcriptional regulator, transcriptional activator of pobA